MNTFHDNPFFVLVDDLDSCAANFAEEGKIVEIADTGCEARVFDETLGITEDGLVITDNQERTRIKKNISNLDGKFRERHSWSPFTELFGNESEWTAAGIGDFKIKNATDDGGRDKKQADKFDRCNFEAESSFIEPNDERRGDGRDNRRKKSPATGTGSIADRKSPRSKSKSRNVWENHAKGKSEKNSSSGTSKIQIGATSMFAGKTYVDKAVDKDSIGSSSSRLQVPVVFEPPPRIRSASRQSWLLGPALRLSSANRMRNASSPPRKIFDKSETGSRDVRECENIVSKSVGEPRSRNVDRIGSLEMTPTNVETKIRRSKLPVFKTPPTTTLTTTSRTNAIRGNAASVDVSSPLPETNLSMKTKGEVASKIPAKSVVTSSRYSSKSSGKILARPSRKSYDLPSRSALPSATRGYRMRMGGRDWRAVDGRRKGKAMIPRLLSDRGKNPFGTSTNRSSDVERVDGSSKKVREAFQSKMLLLNGAARDYSRRRYNARKRLANVRPLPIPEVLDDPSEELELQTILPDDSCSMQGLDGERASLKTKAEHNSESSSKLEDFVEKQFIRQTRPLRSMLGECSSKNAPIDKSRHIQDRKFPTECSAKVGDFHSSKVPDSREDETNQADGSCVEKLKHRFVDTSEDVGVQIRSKISEAEKEAEIIPIMKRSTYHEQPFAEKRTRGDALPQPVISKLDGRRMHAWFSGHEQAYLKGRAIGLRVADMARAAKEQMARDFFRSGLPTVASLPTADKSREIVDIGVSIIENVLGDKNNKNRSPLLRDGDIHSFIGFDTKAKWTDRRWIS